MKMSISQAGGATTSVTLTPEEGEMLREVINRDTKLRFGTYLEKVGLHPSNVNSMLCGRKKMSFQTLTRLLSYTEHEVECHVEFVIQNRAGSLAQDADYPNLDELLYLEDGDELEEAV